MNQGPSTFWQNVYRLREQGLIPSEWKARHLREFLERPEGPYSPNTITVYPFNCSISKEGHGIGDYIKKGQAPRAWRVARGQFRLIADPEDDAPTQEAERGRAMKRAEQLRSRKRRVGGGQDEASAPPRRPLYQPDPQAESLSAFPNRYPSIPVALTPSERQYLAGFSTEEKALSIVREHLVGKYGDRAEIEEDQDGADLRVSIGGKTERIDVKGTKESTIAWQELKVSNKKSHDALKNGDASMYRVVDVDGAEPHICILTYGQHFTLEPEPRWAVKRVPPKDDRYPLRGEPYHYHLPYEPVAADEWEVRE